MANMNDRIVQLRSRLKRCPHEDGGRAALLYELADHLKIRFLEHGGASDLDEAISLHRSALDLRPVGQLNRESSLHQLAKCHWLRYTKQDEKVISDLDEVVSLNQAALQLCPPGHSGRANALHNLGYYLKIRFVQLKDNNDLDEAIALHRLALDLRPEANQERYTSLHELAVCLWKRYYVDQSRISDLEEALVLNRAALELAPPGHSGHAIALYVVADNLKARFGALGKSADLDEAIELHRLALDLRFTNSDRLSSFRELAVCLWKRYNAQNTIRDLEEAIMFNRAELELRPQGNADRDVTLNNLGNNLRDRFLALGDNTDLNDAIEFHRSALDLRSADHSSRSSSRSSSLHYLAICYLHRYSKQGVTSDLEEAISLNRTALGLRSRGHFGRAATLYNLGDTLRIKFVALNEITVLDEATTFHRWALDLRPAGHADRPASLRSFIDCLSSRIEKTGAAADMSDRLKLSQAVLELRGLNNIDHTLFPIVQCRLQEQLQQLDTKADLDECITLGRAILALSGTEDPTRITTLVYLASVLFSRFQKAGTITDLQETVKFGRTAMDLCPPRNPDRAVHLNTLVNHLREMVDRFGELADCNGAVVLAREALELLPAGDPHRASFLSALASFLAVKFHEGGDLADLEEAIELRREELTLSRTAPSLHKLALCLSDRFDKLAVSDDIQEAITLTLSALELCPLGHSDRAGTQKRLALYRLKKIKESMPKAGPDKQIMGAVYDILEILPPRLINTQTGILCHRDALASEFEKSHEYVQLVSSAASYPLSGRKDHIRNAVLSYFKYVTLSHRWGKDEPLIRHIQDQKIYDLKPTDGHLKLQTFCATAAEHGYLWAWSDTCCIDKRSTTELAKSITSMYSWYQRSALTIVYLFDISRDGILSDSEWFGRGWTLQELLASPTVLFYTQEWSLYKDLPHSNHKKESVVLSELERATDIPSQYLTEFKPGMDDARSKLRWASGRRTTEPEDMAYSLFGIFGVFLPVIPGETAENALGRLLAVIISQSGDISVLNWVGEASRYHSCFPARIDSYKKMPCQPSYANKLQVLPDARGLGDADKFLNLLSTLELPHFTGHRLLLPCMVFSVGRFTLKQRSNCVYKIQADGLSGGQSGGQPLEVTFPHELKGTLDKPPFILVRPLESKLLASLTKNFSTIDNAIAMLSQPFDALLLKETAGNNYKRVATSTPIEARATDMASIIKSKVQTVNVL